jgi:hypothetical protein
VDRVHAPPRAAVAVSAVSAARKTELACALGAIAAGLGFACAGASSSTNCLEDLPLVTGGACFNCQESACASEASAVKSACSDYLSCICPDQGAFDPTNVPMCAPDLASSSCASPYSILGLCLAQNCASSCGTGSDSGGTTSISCYYAPTTTASGNCSQYGDEPTASAAKQNGDCTMLKGTPGSQCPTTDELSGCCSGIPGTANATRSTCYYAGTSSTASELAKQKTSTMTFCAESNQDYSAGIP